MRREKLLLLGKKPPVAQLTSVARKQAELRLKKGKYDS
jgi:hypothetical protein